MHSVTAKRSLGCELSPARFTDKRAGHKERGLVATDTQRVSAELGFKQTLTRTNFTT